MENESLVTPDSEPITEPEPPAKGGSNLPVVITLIALLISFGFQTVQLFSERNNLRSVKANQDGAIQEAQKVQAQFKTILTKTTELANQGHAGARFVVEELQKRGVGVAAPVRPSNPEAKTIPPTGK